MGQPNAASFLPSSPHTSCGGSWEAGRDTGSRTHLPVQLWLVTPGAAGLGGCSRAPWPRSPRALPTCPLLTK